MSKMIGFIIATVILFIAHKLTEADISVSLTI